MPTTTVTMLLWVGIKIHKMICKYILCNKSKSMRLRQEIQILLWKKCIKGFTFEENRTRIAVK